MSKPLPTFHFVATILTLALVLGPLLHCVRVNAGEDKPIPPPPPPPSTSAAPGDKKPAAKADTDKTAKPASTDMMSNLDWSATKQSFLDDEKGAVVLSGSAYVRYTGVKLEAENIVFYRETREMYAEGHVKMFVGETEMTGSAAYIDVDSDSGYVVDATVRVTAAANQVGSSVYTPTYGLHPNPLFYEEKAEEKHTLLPGEEPRRGSRDPYGTYIDPIADPQARAGFLLKAEKLIRNSKLHYTLENAFISNDEMVHPIYGLKSGTMDFFLHEIPDPKNPGKTTLTGEKAIAKRAQIQIFGHDLFVLPTLTYDLTRREYFSVHQGNSGRWGNYVLTRFGVDMGPAKGEVQTKPFQITHVYLDLDERTRRGPAAGLEVAWQQQGYQMPGCGSDKTYYEYASGYVRGYGDDEFQISAQEDIDRARKDLERRIQPKIDGFQRIQFDANLLFLRRRALDNAGPPSFAIQRHEDDVRGLAEFSEHVPIKRVLGLENIQTQFEYKRQSDRDFNLEYFPVNYNRQTQSDALASATKAWDDWNLELLYRANPENFDSSPPRSPFDYGTFTGYQPAATFNTMPSNLGYGVFMSSEEQVANMRREFERDIYNQPNFESSRLYSKMDFARPVNLCVLTFTPRVGAQGALYDNSRDTPTGFVGNNTIDGRSISQGALTYGADLDTRIYGNFCDFNNESLGINGLRHIIEPSLSFRGVSNTTSDPVKILDFDEVDDITHYNHAILAVDQTFQTQLPGKDGEPGRAISVAGFDTALDFIPSHGDKERLQDGETFGLLKFDGFIRALDVVRLDAGVGFNPQDFVAETAQYKIIIDTHERWRMQFSERFNYSDNALAITGSDQFHLQFDYELSDRWAVSYEQILEKKKSLQLIKGRQVESLGLTRHFGPFDAAIVYSVDKNLNDHGFYGAVRPTIISRNLILPENDPLVNPTQVSGDGFEEPETRNFDPFQILRQQRLQKKNNKANSKGGDVPAPPQSTSMNDSKGSNLAETVDLDNVPAQKAAPKKAPIDADDWTLPASLPTSARDR